MGQHGTAGVQEGGGCWKEGGHCPPSHSCMRPPILKVEPSNPSHKPPSRGPTNVISFIGADAASHAFPIPFGEDQQHHYLVIVEFYEFQFMYNFVPWGGRKVRAAKHKLKPAYRKHHAREIPYPEA